MSEDRPDFTWEEFRNSGEAPRDDDRFQPCFRHADRNTGIRCQRCGKPICGECMRPASVGFHCPDCVAAQQQQSRPARRPIGARLAGRGFGATIVLMVVMGAVGLIDLVTGFAASATLGMSSIGVLQGQVWRLVTGIVVSGHPINILFNLLFLYLVGRQVEQSFGRWRMLVVMLLSVLGSSTVLMFFGTHAWPGAYAAILGILAAMAAVKGRAGEDVRGDLVLLAVMVGFQLVMGAPVYSWLSLIGALIAGGASGLVLTTGRGRANLTRTHITGFSVIAVVLLALCGAGAVLG